MSRKLIQTKPTTLSYGISSSATAMRLDALYKLDGTSISASDIGDLLYGTFDPGTSREEIFSIVGANVTVNSDGTLDITGVVRGLKEVDPYGTGGFSIDHPAGAIVVFGDNPQVFAEMAQLANDNAFTGDNTVPNPVGAQSIVPRDWILALINGGAITQNALVEVATAGETIAAGNLLYFSETDNEWMKADGDLIATLFNVKMGIAMGAGTNGNPISGGVLTRGSYTTSGLTQGDLCYASNTAGGINSGTPGTVPRVIGIAKSTTVLYFDPDFQNRMYDYAVDAVGTDAYAITLPGALSIPYAGMEIKFKAGTANTTNCTLNVNGSGAVAIKKNVSVELVTGDILANQIVKVVYDGSIYQIVSKTPTITPVVQVFTANGTYTPTPGARWIEVELVDGGTGGSGTGSGSAGGASSFGAYVTSSIGDVLIAGQPGGQPAFYQTNNYVGGPGGSTPLGFGGWNKSGAGTAGTGYGSGGPGGSETGQGHVGGKGGDYSRKILAISAISATVTVTVGAAGAKATGTDYGQLDGKAGIVIVREHF